MTYDMPLKWSVIKKATIWSYCDNELQATDLTERKPMKKIIYFNKKRTNFKKCG